MATSPTTAWRLAQHPAHVHRLWWFVPYPELAN